MSIYIGNDLENRLEALEAENTILKEYNEYHQVVHEINHMSDLHVDSSFYKQSMKLDNYFKIIKWIDFSIGQSTVLQELNKKRPKLSNSDQTQNRRRYVKFENGSHFICSFNLNSPETTVCIAFRLNSIASGNNLLLNGIIGNSIKYVAFFKTHSGLGLLISKAHDGSYVSIANDDSSSIKPDLKFPSSKSDCTILNKWHVISVTWSNVKDLSNCWSNGKKIMTFNTGNIIGDHLAPRFNQSCGVMSATAQLCSPTISPKVVLYFSNPCIVHHQSILCLQLHNCAVVRSLLKSYAIVVIPALPRLDQIPTPVK